MVFKKPAEDAPKTPTKDPWNYWVFQLSGNTNFNGEASTKSLSYNLNGSASRMTDRWKINFNANSNKNSNTFYLDDGSTVKSATRSWSDYSQAVKSLNGHWSIGGTATVSHSSYSNENRVYKLAPGIEYDFFPTSNPRTGWWPCSTPSAAATTTTRR